MNDVGVAPASRDASAAAKAKPTQRLTAGPAAHFEPIGLSLVHPYVRGKVPVVFIHGLGETPQSWGRMIEHLEANPIIRDHYQLWTFGYARVSRSSIRLRYCVSRFVKLASNTTPRRPTRRSIAWS